MPTIVVVGASRGLVPVLQHGFPDHDLLVIDEPSRSRLPSGVELPPHDSQNLAGAAHVAAMLRRRNVTAVIPALEYSTVFAAKLSELLGLPGATSYAAETLRDKGLLRQRTHAVVRSPLFRLTYDLEDARSFAGEVPAPWIVKPTDRQAGSGVRVVERFDELESAWRYARTPDSNGPELGRGEPAGILVEQLVPGRELSVEAIVLAGRLMFTNVSETQIFAVNATRVEEGHIAPACVTEAERNALIAELGKLIDAIGFETGIVHAEWILNDDGPHLIECAGRLPGDNIAELISYAHGFDLVQAYVSALNGVPPLTLARPRQVYSVRYLRGGPQCTAAATRVSEMPGVVRAVAEDGPFDANRFEASWDRSGYVIVGGNTQREVRELLDRAVMEFTASSSNQAHR